MTTYSPRQLLAAGLDTAIYDGPYSRTAVIAVVAICFVALLDISDVVCAFVGALGYLLFCSTRNAKPTQPVKHVDISTHDSRRRPPPPAEPHVRTTKTRTACPEAMQPQETSGCAQQDAYKPSVCPVVCPSFASADWDGQINEFLRELAPTDETGALARAIACAVQDALRSTFPDVDVVGFAHGNPKSSRAFATAVPDIEIVARMASDLSVYNQKAAIRSCTDQLAYGDFKFRRSAFKYDEPKVTFLAPAALGCVPFDFAVNALTPGRHDIILQECIKIDPRAWELILLVHRWSRDRGIAHAAKGHLTPYAWSLVVLFFLQIREKGEGALIPAFKTSSPHFQLEGKKRKASKKTKAADTPRTPVSMLFKEFFAFYATQFDWQHEMLSVEKATRVVPDMNLVEWRRQAEGLQICDPFEPASNLGALLSNDGRARLQEELTRAMVICSENGLLSQLLQPWSPPDGDVAGKPTSFEESKIKKDVLPKSSSPGSLTAPASCGSLRPKSSSPGSLTAPCLGLSLRPQPSSQGSLTASPMGFSLRPSASDKSNGVGTSAPSALR